VSFRLLAFVGGVLSIALYPTMVANNTYMSENALTPGIGTAYYERTAAQSAIAFSRLQTIPDLVKQLKRMDLPYRVSTFPSGSVLTALLRAPRGDGSESIALVAQLSDLNLRKDEVNPVGLLLSLVSFLEGERWLCKDILLVIVDSSEPEHTVQAWLHEYHFSTIAAQHGAEDIYGGVLHAGVIQVALVLDFEPLVSMSHLVFKPVSVNGLLPNLDLLNAAARITRWNGGPDVWLMDPAEFDVPSTAFVAEASRLFSDLVSLVQPVKNPDVANLFLFMWKQARGSPTGLHAFFLPYHIDAFTMKAIRVSGGKVVSVEKLGGLLECTIRCANNLIEQLHQSFFYYLLTSAYTYVSIGQYMISLAAVVSPMLLAFLWDSWDLGLEDALIPLARWAVFQAVGGLLFVLPLWAHFWVDFEYEKAWLSMLVGVTPVLFFAILPFVSQLVSGFFSSGLVERQNPLTTALAVRICGMLPMMVFISACSLVNFSFAFGVSCLVVPMAVLIGRGPTNRFTSILHALLLLLLSPPALLMGMAHLSGMDVVSLLFYLVNQYTAYTALFFPFFSLIYVPFHLSLIDAVLHRF